MPYYLVNATVSFSTWLNVEADTPEQAVAEARERGYDSGWEYDTGTADLDFNIDPLVEVE